MLTETVEELQALRLGPMAERLKQWVDDPNNRGKSHAECVHALALAQAQAAAAKRSRCFSARADLPPNIAVADVWASAARGLPAQLLGNLKSCDWIRLGHTVVITGATRTGKTYLAAALAKEAALARLTVAFWRVPELLTACAFEKQQGTFTAFLKRLSRIKLLVLDDFAAERATADESHWLRQLLDGRERHGLAVMVASPNAVEDWDGYFEDVTAAEAIFGRLLERSKPIVLKRMPTPKAPRR
ncbi:DNA replication protein DnaC [Rhodanobacter sp. K2T2]|uniref:ATP-binding protein n=1 Tax=Rhodanobacter sp. K2T2 TaxID=2723085 RepID=UPI0015C87CE2|nr:ATP-binding protein [Rhodanobacter sp. K2T2]NYE30955.1 DNA replication protein DnaC [Rhodanobacter sp. K2T2]